MWVITLLEGQGAGRHLEDHVGELVHPGFLVCLSHTHTHALSLTKRGCRREEGEGEGECAGTSRTMLVSLCTAASWSVSNEAHLVKV